MSSSVTAYHEYRKQLHQVQRNAIRCLQSSAKLFESLLDSNDLLLDDESSYSDYSESVDADVPSLVALTSEKQKSKRIRKPTVKKTKDASTQTNVNPPRKRKPKVVGEVHPVVADVEEKEEPIPKLLTIDEVEAQLQQCDEQFDLENILPQ